MTEPFDIPVLYNGKQLYFPAQLQPRGFTHQFTVDVYGDVFVFEPDEEGSYRVLLTHTERAVPEPDVALLQAIAQALASLV